VIQQKENPLKNTETTEENTMNAKTERQIENLKNQTIGVEIEMNHITRERAAKLAADFFGTGRYENTARRNGYCTWSAWDDRTENGNFREMFPSQDAIPKNANWSHRF
jgi:hypothetical protein